MTTPAGEMKSFELQSEWEIDPRSQPAFVNQVILQPGVSTTPGGSPSGVYLRFGHANPPVFPEGLTPEVLMSFGAIPISVVGQFFLPGDVMRALRDSLDGVLKAFESDASGPDGL